MKKKLQRGFVLIALSCLLTSCGAIFGGSQYYAHVSVDNKPNAKIYHENELKGTGHATIKLLRKDADKLSFTVKDEQGQQQVFDYKSKIFRGWAFAGSFITFTGVAGGIPLPFGVAADLAAGTLWKPDEDEKGIIKQDYKHYEYHLEFSNPTKVPEAPKESIASEAQKERIASEDLVYTKDGIVHSGVIVELEPNDYVKIKKKDQSILTLKYNDIEKITKGQVQ